ncbi:MAG TPA: hypothetical protein VJQ82_04340 [Terriglobales bacterium]|nr:hypothetical protein [Terriglobales bacterium]
MTSRKLQWGMVLILLLPSLAAAVERNWQTGTLTDTEQTREKEGSTKHTTSDGSVKNKGNKADYSQTTNSTESDNIEVYQNYTIESGNKIYVAREHLLFPWSKPANLTVGENVKFVVEKGKMVLLDDDGKEHKAAVVKTSMKPTS